MATPPTIEYPEPLGFFFDQNYCRYRIAYGGRSSGKSWTAAQALIVRALQKKIRILCCREIQNSIKDSVKKTLDNCIERMGWSDYFTGWGIAVLPMKTRSGKAKQSMQAAHGQLTPMNLTA